MELVKKTRRIPKGLSATLYSYVEPDNAKHAKTIGKQMFGSFSAYVNALIAKDRGVKPVLGFWKAKGEAQKKREALERVRDRKLSKRTYKK